MSTLAARTHAATIRDLQEIVNGRILGTLARHRFRIGAIFAAVLSVLVWVDIAAWRFVFVGVVLSAVAAVAARQEPGKPLSGRRFALTACSAATAQIVVAFALGGIAGPAFPALVLVAFVLNLLAPRAVGVWFVAAVQVPAVWLFAWAQAAGTWPELVPSSWTGQWARPGTGGAGPWIAAAVGTLLLVGAMTLGRVLRGVVVDLVAEKLADRERELGLHAAAAEGLSRMSAEIAHELKNPLASVKGLAALVRKDLGPGATAERMDVLRREVDRMQAILEDFLSYSRPLVPLDEDEVDLAALAREVATLHEGLARPRRILLEAPQGEVLVRCDARKIRQVLVNLVQNALEASPDGTTVRIEVERGGHGACVRVLDEGAGLAEGAVGRLFEVGFTTKPHGSGIGLAVARGLARQHGGDLELGPRSPRGCTATLRLPGAPAEHHAADRAMGGGA